MMSHNMSREEFRLFLNLFMASDGSLSDDEDAKLAVFANHHARYLGFEGGWVAAMHIMNNEARAAEGLKEKTK